MAQRVDTTSRGELVPPEIALPEIVALLAKFPGWQARALFTTDRTFAGLRLKRLAIEPTDPNAWTGSATHRMFQAVPIGRMQREALVWLSLMVPPLDTPPSTRARKSGRPVDTWPDEELSRLARRYVQVWEAGERPVYERLAKEWPYQSENSLRTAVTVARERGLLTKTTPGVGGGKLTPKAKRLLRAKETER